MIAVTAEGEVTATTVAAEAAIGIPRLTDEIGAPIRVTTERVDVVALM